MTLLQNFHIFYSLFGSDSLVKLGATPLFTEILNHFNNSVHNNTQLKLVFYSAHDYNLVSLLRGLNFSNWQCILDSLWSETSMSDHPNCESVPKFASSMNFELYEEKEAYFVKVIYDGKEMELCQGADRFCTLEEFTAKMKNGISDDFVSLCGQQIHSNTYHYDGWWYDPLIVLMYTFLITAIAIFCYKCLKELNLMRKSKELTPFIYNQELESQTAEEMASQNVESV